MKTYAEIDKYLKTYTGFEDPTTVVHMLLKEIRCRDNKIDKLHEVLEELGDNNVDSGWKDQCDWEEK